MNQQQFDKLSNDLRALANKIPLHWGDIQNNACDDQINMFALDSYADLETALAHLPEDQKNYLRRRWYLWKCSQCDEYLFYINPDVEKNPNSRDKAFDICINHHLQFDIKGTVIPRQMRHNAESVIADPRPMIDFFYEKQSRGRRFNIQNRLFIVHHSFVDYKRELYQRCAWKSKREFYQLFCQNADRISFYSTHGVMAGVIFIIERTKNQLECSIFGMSNS